jgi:protein-tyrosine phosphatase
MTKITSNVYLGNIQDARKYYNDFDIIINVSEVSLKSLHSMYKGILIEIPIIDSPSTNLKPYLTYTNIILDKARDKGQKVLINCYKGISRSASILIGWLIHRGISYEEAYDLVFSKRNIIYPNSGFRDQLKHL